MIADVGAVMWEDVMDKTLHSTIHPNVDTLTRRFDWALQRGAKLSFLAASWCERLTGAMLIFDLLIFVFLSADE